ncbi:bacteriohemerythrin [Thiolapillus sp.]
MKDLIWDNTLSVQIQEIDDDHRKLIDLFNLLNHAVEEGDSADYIHALLEELINCTVWHFSHEERLMLKYAYDGLAEHKQEHQELIRSIKALQQQLLNEGKTVSLDDLEFLEHWLTGHILGTDMDLGAYLGEAM